MAPKERLDWCRGNRERTRDLEEAGQLIPVARYEAELAAPLKLVALTLESLPDVLERDAGLDAPAVERVQARCATGSGTSSTSAWWPWRRRWMRMAERWVGSAVRPQRRGGDPAPAPAHLGVPGRRRGDAHRDPRRLCRSLGRRSLGPGPHPLHGRAHGHPQEPPPRSGGVRLPGKTQALLDGWLAHWVTADPGDMGLYFSTQALAHDTTIELPGGGRPRLRPLSPLRPGLPPRRQAPAQPGRRPALGAGGPAPGPGRTPPGHPPARPHRLLLAPRLRRRLPVLGLPGHQLPDRPAPGGRQQRRGGPQDHHQHRPVPAPPTARGPWPRPAAATPWRPAANRSPEVPSRMGCGS